jgi:hypothetical protein
MGPGPTPQPAANLISSFEEKDLTRRKEKIAPISKLSKKLRRAKKNIR